MEEWMKKYGCQLSKKNGFPYWQAKSDMKKYNDQLTEI